MKESELLKTISAGIRRCRQAQGLTIEKLAEKARVDAGFLAHIEVSAKKPSLNVLARIIEGLSIAPEELFWTDRAKKGSLGHRVEAVLRGLPARQQEDLLAVLGRLRRAEDIRALKVLLRAA